ncbi:MAG: response regulator, partial [Prochloraceae cyanobacterium]
LWTQNSLGPYSPNLAPTIAELERLEKEVNSSVYQNFVTLLDGHNTLRDLALQMQSDPMTITCSLLPYINRGFIQLSEVGDIKLPLELVVAKHPTLSSRKPSTATIACIDDSLQITLVMEQIMLKAGYKFLGIQQPLQAIPQLICQPPDLIFLDVRMPIINGYELCSQIRRISQLEKIPIIMLTGQDGIVDRMRAKLVGACDFVSKPIDDKKIIKVVEKFLSEFDAPILQ